ncbi:MAG: type II restriction endonuclease, partial [Chitinophagia bacterium]|nr:type II restriction endonuclease [Chitinophagia bacterium]
MLPFQVSKPRESLNIAYRFQKVMKRDYDLFKSHLALYFNNIDEQESEEHNKNSIAHFLKNVWYDTSYTVNSRRRTDLAISLPYGNPKPVGAFFEMKTPGNTAEMPTAEKPNCKALQQLLLYYLDLRIEDNQHQLCRLVITNAYDWYLFDSTWWETHIYQNKTLIKQYQDYKRSGHNTPYFYDSIAKPFFNALETPMPCTYFNLKDYKQALENDQPEVLVVLYKILSPAHLLKQPFANDSNSLDTGFYHELLYITGLEEQKIKGQIKIVRRKNTIPASLLEQVYAKLDSKNCLKKIEQPQNYGANKEEQLFHLSLELCLTWLNRILFIKLLDSQIKGYHKEETEKGFLHSDTLNEFADVNDLFFEVLAKPLQQRQPHIAQKFSGVPYLNSSLFERTALEAATIEIDVLQNNVELPIWQHTVLKDSNGKKLDGSKRLLPYIIAFLDAYDFSSESKSAIQQNNKNLIGASVLGLIFEKINGYKDGSHFTPGAVTSYMCRETIRRAVLQKFREKEQYSECA